jgi:hypothetical protein
LQNFFVWHRKPFNGIEGRYRAEKNADRRMIPIGADWWEVCEPDFVANTAHVRWSKVDADRIGNSQPFQSLVTNVLLRTDDVERLWPAGKTKGVPKRPVGTGLQDADAPLIDQMRAYMIEKNLRAPTRAANALFNRGVDIPGDGEPVNKITRLVKRYKAKFG